MFNPVEKGFVCVLPGVFRERMNTNRAYLLELDSQCLLQNFYLEAGIIMPGLQVVDDPAKANLHWGWEAPLCQLRGHFLGHWLSAASFLIASEHDAELKVKLDHIISELARCQKLNGGEWIGSIPEKYFTKLITNDYIWSPQYTMHKTIMGLMHAYQFAENKQALEIIDHLSDWYVHWTDTALKENPRAVFGGEAGGMLEIWASLFEITQKDKYMQLANKYKDAGLFTTIAEGKDALTNCHANASIPLSHGAAKMYEITGDEKWRKVVELFWKCAVTDRGMYATSGQNAGEFWIPPFMQGHFLGENNQEFCTVYNMVRTANYLFKWTGKKEYADYIERCLYNGFLAQQNSTSGTPTYFLPLKAGSHKKWGTKTRDFWCCHGTMVQAQTLYPDLIYFTEKTTDNAPHILVTQYIPSTVTIPFGEESVTIEQTTAMKYYNDQSFFDEHDDSQMSRWFLKFKINCTHKTAVNPTNILFSESGTISFRIPAWVKSLPTVLICGKPVNKLSITDGWLNIPSSSLLHNQNNNLENILIEIFFPSAIVMEHLKDMPELAAAVDGPIVLAGLTEADTGISGDFAHPESFLIPQIEHTYGTFPWKQNWYRTRNQNTNFSLKPLYEITDETYTVYFTEK